MRRQLNEAFAGPDGQFSILKTIAIFGQISSLYQMNMWFDALIVNSTAMLIVMTFIIAPHLIVRLAGARLGTTTTESSESTSSKTVTKGTTN